MLNNVDSLENENDILKQNIHFQEELQNILTLLVKENSIQVIAEEILIRAVKNCDGLFGVIYHNYEDNKLSFTKYDPNNNLEHINDFKKEINANLSFINKWLANHSKPLIGTNKQNNIGNTLNSIFQSSTILITPCLSNDKLFATLIIGKKKGKFSKFDVATTTQFASLFAFGVSSINTKKLNITLEKKLLQAQKLETIGKLSSGMAHDFNNLLSGIFGSVDLLKKRLPNEPKFTKLVDNIEQCSIRARDLTKGLLSYGKPTAKRKEIIKPTSLLGDLIKVISSTFPKGIDIITNIAENLPDVLGNSVELYQVLLNLCVNAKEAIDNKGTISIIAKKLNVGRKNRHNHPLLNMGNYVWITVKDSGQGIDEENLLKIFDPYYSTKEKDAGSGLGLYVSYGIVKALKGEILVSSKKDMSTTFDVFLPAYEPTKTNKKIVSEKIILLADDEPMLKELLSDLLEPVGYSVIMVDSGLEVLRVLKEEMVVDMIIIDYSMPDMDGLTCTEEIRKLNFKMPIVLSSGSLAFEENLNWKKKGVTKILTKPYEFNVMLNLIEELI
ncbi:MAG: response regulator [Bacteroidetes bacterium]|nr:response regulator [Bacteroidota bacterium]MCH8325637.1 response regulator [Bacteroidota bacterium]